MLLKSNHSDKSLVKTWTFDLKLIELFTILFVFISFGVYGMWVRASTFVLTAIRTSTMRS